MKGDKQRQGQMPETVYKLLLQYIVYINAEDTKVTVSFSNTFELC